MAEVKKETKAKSTKTAPKTSKVEKPKVDKVIEDKVESEVVNTPQTQAIPFDMATMQQMFAMFQQMQQAQNTVVEEKKEDLKQGSKSTKFTKTMLANIGEETITVRSAIDSVVFLSPKTSIKYKWLNIGDVEAMKISEVLTMESSSLRFLHTPWLIVEDDRVTEALGLTKMYDDISKVEDVEKLITMNKEEIEGVFNRLPKEYKDNFKNDIILKVASRELSDLNVIDTLKSILNIELN